MNDKVADQPKLETGIPYELFLDCVHCGLCTAACPTYVELGTEMDSPRGRIYLMRAVTDGRVELTSEVRRHLELCLDCRSCESACPSGVQYGRLIEPFRIAMEKETNGAAPKTSDWFHKLILFGMFPFKNRIRLALAPARMAQVLRLDRLAEAMGLFRLLPNRLQQLQAMLPRFKYFSPPLPSHLPAEGQRRARVALFTGCIGDVLFRETNWATARVLQKNGCDVVIPTDQSCCGAIHYHAGAEQPAEKLMRQNCDAFNPDDVDAIIVNVAGCGSMLKDYHHVLPSESRAEKFAAKVRDVSEFLMELGPVQPEGAISLRATYHDACHLCHAQQIRSQPRDLLRLIPDLELVSLNESELCCGAAGTYNLTEPEMSARLLSRKIECIMATESQAVFTANAGCLLQIARGLRQAGSSMWAAHPIDVLDMSYRQQTPTLPG